MSLIETCFCSRLYGILFSLFFTFKSQQQYCCNMYPSRIWIYLAILKSDNLQCNVPGHWVDWTIVSLTKRCMFQTLLFSIISCKILCKNPFNLCFYNFKKWIHKEVWVPDILFSIYQNNTWTIRCLVDERINPAYYIEDCWI